MIYFLLSQIVVAAFGAAVGAKSGWISPLKHCFLSID